MAEQHRRRSRRGTVSGYLFKLIRESIPATQENLAEDLGVDRGTVQGWESGRRPFTSVAFGHAIAIRQRLARLGADTTLLSALEDAAEADYMLDQIIDTDPARIDLLQHPVGWSVLNHRLTDFMHWAIVGEPPAVLAQPQPQPQPQPHTSTGRRGPSPSGPELSEDEKRTFFTNLEILADRTSRRRDEEILLHRQVCFLAGIDPRGTTAKWLCRISAPGKTLVAFDGWSPLWPDGRSVATSLAKQGDPQLLRDFIARAHPDDTCERAGLNYWAYWVGEIDHRQRDDMFMTSTAVNWRGGRLLRHLADRLDSGHPLVDLNVHSLWALLTWRRGLARDDSRVGVDLVRRCERLLDEGSISAQSHRELTSVLYGLRMDGLTAQEATL